MCHLLADTVEELHAMAERIGLRRDWFQSHGMPHYDICREKRQLAISAGAREIDRRHVGRLIRAWRAGNVQLAKR